MISFADSAGGILTVLRLINERDQWRGVAYLLADHLDYGWEEPPLDYGSNPEEAIKWAVRVVSESRESR